MLTEIKDKSYHYFVDEYDRTQGKYMRWYTSGQLHVQCWYLNDERHGEYKQWNKNGRIGTHCFFTNGKRHGELKQWWLNGCLGLHCFYINDNFHSFKAIPYPETEEDRMYFKLKYDIPLLPLETTC